MTAASRLALRGRRRAEALMIDECIIRRPPRLGEMDPDTLDKEREPGEIVYMGRCKVQTYEPHESTPESGRHRYTVQRYYVHLPVGAADVQVNDEINLTLLSLDPAPHLHRYRVAGLLHKTFATAQRLLVDEIPPTAA